MPRTIECQTEKVIFNCTPELAKSFRDLARANERSLAAEMRVAIRERLSRTAQGQLPDDLRDLL